MLNIVFVWLLCLNKWPNKKTINKHNTAYFGIENVKLYVIFCFSKIKIFEQSQNKNIHDFL